MGFSITDALALRLLDRSPQNACMPGLSIPYEKVALTTISKLPPNAMCFTGAMMMTTHDETSRADALTDCIGSILFAAENVISADRARARDDADIKALERAVQSALALLTASAAEPPAVTAHKTGPEAAGLMHAATPSSFQARVQPWMLECFGAKITTDRTERNHRFLEEALELVQACGCTASEAHQFVDYTFGRPAGEPAQEVGGVMVTLAALCLANELDMHAAGETELADIWTKVDKIRAKHAAKPKYAPPSSAV
ncbi:hypothetical protein [Burkholderia stagnalis]|uniref:hypothetical protein n=1 Tax=Burkholderia stagnalis TaxID=1503054 RepID=UPI0019D1156E|nr:hypothetical protein [Burkholderia stagnalis]